MKIIIINSAISYSFRLYFFFNFFFFFFWAGGAIKPIRQRDMHRPKNDKFLRNVIKCLLIKVRVYDFKSNFHFWH